MINVIIVALFMFAGLVFYNKMRVKGKMLAFIARKDKSLLGRLCELRGSFVIWEDRAYDVYPDFVRLVGYPMGWPAMLQELVPASLYDEDDALPKDWITLEAPKEGSLSLRAALDENWIKKLVAETSAAKGFTFNWRKVLPVVLLVGGGLGLLYILKQQGIM